MISRIDPVLDARDSIFKLAHGARQALSQCAAELQYIYRTALASNPTTN